MAAAKGVAEAQYDLGQILEKGKAGKRDLTEAFALYKAAAEQGFAPAQERVGQMYATGAGVTADASQAYFWSTLAAKQNEKNAERRLAAMAARLPGDEASKVKQSATEWKPVVVAAGR